MSVVFTCECGKRLKVSDDRAGKRVRCPSCGEVRVVPQVSTSSTIDPVVKSTASVAAFHRAFPDSLKSHQQSGFPIVRAIFWAVGGLLVVLLVGLVLVGAFVPMENSTAPANPPQKKSGGYVDALIKARKKGRSTGAGVSMQQIGLAFTMYRLQNDDAWPDTLEQLRPFLSGFDNFILDPQTGEPNFIYVKPAAGPAGPDPSSTPVLYEALSGQPNPSGAVLYADGRVTVGR